MVSTVTVIPNILSVANPPKFMKVVFSRFSVAISKLLPNCKLSRNEG